VQFFAADRVIRFITLILNFRTLRSRKYLLNSLPLSDILNKFSIMLVPIILEENKDEKLMLG
jgi:hypothetical protein